MEVKFASADRDPATPDHGYSPQPLRRISGTTVRIAHVSDGCRLEDRAARDDDSTSPVVFSIADGAWKPTPGRNTSPGGCSAAVGVKLSAPPRTPRGRRPHRSEQLLEPRGKPREQSLYQFIYFFAPAGNFVCLGQLMGGI